MRFLVALLAASLPLLASGQAQLLPAGKFAARDGRPANVGFDTWEVTDAQGASLAVDLNAIAAKTPIVIDYEHQTLNSEKNGQAAPAAGWIKQVEWRNGAGLFASVEWTAKAKSHIDAGEYRYISPVLQFDKQTGRVVSVMHAALVNFPALLGMEPVVAQLAAKFNATFKDWTPASAGVTHLNPQEPQMDLAALIALFGLAAGTTPIQCMAFLTGLKADVDGLAALKVKLGLEPGVDLAALSAHIAGLTTQVEALKANTGKADPGTLAAMQALQTQVATLTGQINQREITELVDGSIAAHKLVPAQRDWALKLGQTDLAALKAYVASAQPIPGLAGQSGGREPGDTNTAALTGLGAQVMAQFGLTPEQFAKGAAKTAAAA